MSRLSFARKIGAEPHNARNAWSYINHSERFVLFGAWHHTEVAERQLIFSNTWQKDANGRRPSSYAPSLRHLEHILEDGYKLFTFRQYAVPSSLSGIPKIERFDEVYEERYIEVQGGDYFAVTIRPENADTTRIEPTDYSEGERFEVIQTHFERNRRAREICLKHYGVKCQVCEFDFQTIYGPLGTGFIHVHHIVPVSLRKTSYKLDPIKDLLPVCPNCHAMLHRKSPPISISKMQKLISSKSTLE